MICNFSDTPRKIEFGFFPNLKECDRGDSFSADCELNGIPFVLKSKRKLSLRSI